MDRVLDVANAVAPSKMIKSQTGNAMILDDYDALCRKNDVPEPAALAVQQDTTTDLAVGELSPGEINRHQEAQQSMTPRKGE
jgi:hypothetical protein